jgi:signal peptidase I
MPYHRRWISAVFSAFWIVLMVAIWMKVAPVQAGGGAAYVLIIGNSMEPDFHIGDLVVVRQESEYRIDDLVAYRNLELENNVFHRIIATDRDRFVLKGDNNSWIDSFQPSRDEVIGKLWVHIPQGGSALQSLRRPGALAALAAITGGILAFALVFRNGKGKKTMSRKPIREAWLSTQQQLGNLIGNIRKNFTSTHGSSTETTSLMKGTRNTPPTGEDSNMDLRQWGNITEGLFFGLGLIAFLSLLAGLFSFTRPGTRVVPDDINFQHLGFFSYEAKAPAGIYDSDTVRSGEPIFPNLTCQVNMGFNYTLLAEQVESVGGTYQLTALLSDPLSGWQRTLPLQEQTVFAGTTFNTQTGLDLCQITSLIERVEQETNFRPGYYMLSITPRVALTGTVAGSELQSAFEPNLTFKYDRVQFYLIHDDPESDPLAPVEMGIIRNERREANTLSIFGLEVSVPPMRVGSVLGFVLSGIGLLGVGMHIQGISRTDQPAFVRMKYDPIMIDVQGDSTIPSSHAVAVSSIEDLAKLAEKHNGMILHEAQGTRHNYSVEGNGVTYLFSFTGRYPEVLNGSQALVTSEIRRGLEQGQFQVYYQPIVSLRDGKISAVEALLRWQHPERGLITASEFINIAESSGLIEKLDEVVLQIACTQLKSWRESGIDLSLAVNLSNRNLEGNPANLLRRILLATGVNPGSLQIEIAEEKMVKQSGQMSERLHELQDLGVKIALDNFAGLTPISTFGQFPFTSIKMDRLVVDKINNPDEAMNIQRMIAIALNLDMDVVAKGVETDVQRGFLDDQDCPHAQGYLLGRPVPAQDIIEMIQEQPGLFTSPSRKKRSGTKKEKR